jgi:hypothetical protein
MEPAMTMRSPAATGVLWASAFVLAALIIIQAGRLPANQAQAQTATSGHGFSVVTANSGRGDEADPYELVYIIDSRADVLLVYAVEDARQGRMNLLGGGSLENLFKRARR